MPRANVEDLFRYLTSTQAARELGLTVQQLDLRLKRYLLPVPTLVKDNGLRLFSREWLEMAKNWPGQQKGS